MFDHWINAFWLSFVFVTGIAVILLAIGGVLVATLSAREYFGSRSAEPIDWFDVKIPPAPRRTGISTPAGRSRLGGQREPTTVVVEGVSLTEAYRQEELPF